MKKTLNELLVKFTTAAAVIPLSILGALEIIQLIIGIPSIPEDANRFASLLFNAMKAPWWVFSSLSIMWLIFIGIYLRPRKLSKVELIELVEEPYNKYISTSLRRLDDMFLILNLSSAALDCLIYRDVINDEYNIESTKLTKKVLN